jgi:PmbA protein
MKKDEALGRLIDLALRRGAAEADVFYSEAEEMPVLFEANRLKQVTARQIAGVALRVVADGHLGAAASSHPQGLDELVEMALESARYGPQAHLHFPPPQSYPDVPTYDPSVPSTTLEEMVRLGEGLIAAVQAEEEGLVCEASVRRTVQEVMGLNSRGGRFHYRRTVFSVGLYGTLVRGTDMLFVGDAKASCQPIGDVMDIVQEVKRQLHWARHTARVRTGELPVIFTPLGVASALVGPLTLAFSGRLVHQGQSPLAHLLGHKAYDPRLTIWDDPTLPYRPASRICDDEGIPSRRLPLVEGGRVCHFLYDLQTAGMAGAQPTGHGYRTPAGQTSIAPSCLVVEPGEGSLEEIIASLDEGLVVDQLMGAGQGNVMAGDFSGNVLLGYKIERGEVVGRVKDTVVAGNVHQLLKERVLAIGGRPRWVGGGLLVPPIAFTALSVAANP